VAVVGVEPERIVDEAEGLAVLFDISPKEDKMLGRLC